VGIRELDSHHLKKKVR